MEATETKQTQVITQEIYDYAANLLINTDKNSFEVKKLVMEKGYDDSTASELVQKLEEEISKAKKTRAGKDILYGSLWCVGGTILTVADTGFIFWGAIVFGGIQLIKGLVNYLSAN
jgi:hypothetical protein